MAKLDKKQCDKLVELCDKYISGILFVAGLQRACPTSIYCAASNERAEIHEQICELIGKDHCDDAVLKITNYLDEAIGLDFDAEYNSTEIRDFAIKLARKLLEV